MPQTCSTDRTRIRIIQRTGPLIGLYALLAVCLPGCLPENAGSAPPIARADIEKTGQYLLASELNVEDALWLEILPDGDAPGIGGYLSPDPGTLRSLVVIVPGATTIPENGTIAHALEQERDLGRPFRDAGFRTWTLARSQCGTPYGEDDYRETLAAIDWLQRDGAARLGVERIFLLGYSTGATVAALISCDRELDGVAVVSGLLEPAQIFAARLGMEFLAAVYPRNEGFCQVGSTLRHYGKNGDPSWERLNTVARLNELKSPAIFVHGGDDIIYFSFGFFDLVSRFHQLRDSGVELPAVEFLYLPEGDHFETIMSDSSRRAMVDFFARQADPTALAAAQAGENAMHR